MATLKEKAQARSGGSTSSLAGKAKARMQEGPPKDMIAKDDPPTNTPNISSDLPYDAPPPLPPTYPYIGFMATIPGLRKRAGM